MARTSARAAKAAPAPEPETTEEGAATRGPGEMHEIFSEWLEKETGVTVDPNHIYLVTSRRTAFRKSDEYLDYQEGRDELRAEAAKEKASRPKPAPKAKAEDETPAPSGRRGRRGKAAVEPVVEEPQDDSDAEGEEGIEETPTPAPAAGRRGRRAAAVPAAAEQAEGEATPARGRRGRRAASPAAF